MPITEKQGNVIVTRPTPKEEEYYNQQVINQYGGATAITSSSKEEEDQLYDQYMENRANAAMIAAITGDNTAIRQFEEIEQNALSSNIEQLGAVTEASSIMTEEEPTEEAIKMYRLINCLGLGESLTSSPY